MHFKLVAKGNCFVMDGSGKGMNDQNIYYILVKID